MMSIEQTVFDWNLAELLQGIVDIDGLEHVSVQDITLDSRQVMIGSLFIACRGMTVDASEYIDSAIRQGAVAVLWEPPGGTVCMPLAWKQTETAKVPVIAVENLSSRAGLIADRFFASPSQAIAVTGITGTNGKTSCSHFIAQVLSAKGRCGLSGTLGTGVYGELAETQHTTPDVVAVHRWLYEMKLLRVTDAVMEVSSHALAQNRVDSVTFDCAVFTNLSHDHLDYHGDMQSYENAKLSLFTEHRVSKAVINIDDPAGQRFVNSLPAEVECLSYGLEAEHSPDVYGKIISLGMDGIQLEVTTASGTAQLHSQLLGRFNASNLLAVLSVLLIKDYQLEDAVAALSTISSVTGRMQQINGAGCPLVVVDYAHTPDALKLALQSLREHCAGELWCVFGCGGDRDRAKRPVMGELAERFADHVVLTNDNPRSEKPEYIISDILKGFTDNDAVHIEYQREEAIRYAIMHAGKNDLVLVAGKGHENYQVTGEEKLYFSDIESVRRILQEGCDG